MTDLDLLHAVEAALPGLAAWHRDLYALARLRVARGEPLKATQRSQLARILHLAMQARLQTIQARWEAQEVPHAD